jgi:hypothetical protein
LVLRLRYDLMVDPKSKAPEKPTVEERAKRAEEAFIRGLIECGEAAKADEKGNLPPGATHEIVGPPGAVAASLRMVGAGGDARSSDGREAQRFSSAAIAGCRRSSRWHEQQLLTGS